MRTYSFRPALWSVTVLVAASSFGMNAHGDDAKRCADVVAPVVPKLEQTLNSAKTLDALAREDVQRRVNETRNENLRMAPGRVLFTQFVRPKDPSFPTFLLMPGVNRSFLMNDPACMMLASQGYGVAIMNFSTQPFSIAKLDRNERPFFRGNTVTLRDLAEETEFFANRLTSDSTVGEIVPVSLSYSGAVSTQLRGFSTVIDTVPMTSTNAASPELAQYDQMLKNGILFNPFFGPGIRRMSLDMAYQKQWATQTDAISKQFQLSPDRRDDMIRGYTSMSQAAEDFDYQKSSLAKQTRRVFLIADRENPTLLRHQLVSFQKLLATRDDSLLFMISQSGHILPTDQPAAYVTALALATKPAQNLPAEGLILFSPQNNETRVVTGDAADATIAEIIRVIDENAKATRK